jgi:hypothetical protein
MLPDAGRARLRMTSRIGALASGTHALGSAIGSAVRTNATYNACMEAQGYVDAPPAPGT